MSDKQVAAPSSLAARLESYEAVLLGVLMMIATYFLTMAIFTLRTRVGVFRRTHMRQFDEIHQKEVKQSKAPSFGYPDCGSGWYSKSLSYADWYKMNCAQRCQLNFLEQLPIVLVGALVAGIEYRTWTFVICVVYSVARLMYGFGYMHSPKGRVPGAILQDIAVLGFLGLGFSSAYKLAFD
uniref:Microsomal glutathione S-transferase 3 n=1 Tax=Strombidium rassoulzadegani TaxID=1082188 RepID=A0A7S3CPA3_9SPIT